MNEKLTTREVNLLNKFGKFYCDLLSGVRSPETKAQERFIRVCKGMEEPESEHEIAFSKYQKILAARRDVKSSSTHDLTTASSKLENDVGQRSYPARMDQILNDAADWARRNGFKL